ncbi:peroxiredoxin [Halobacteriales archaeon QH_10_67_22]|nr:MAG: peroxiredoxin [Halobacteriales archaeon QH_10_67_22]
MVEFDVVELAPADHPAVGEQAPDFERPLVGPEYWEDTALSDLTDEGPVVLVFHPMDGAFPTTYMYNEFRDRGWLPSTREGEDEDGEADDRAYELVGLSISTPYEHKTLLEERGVDARVFSDPANGVAESYGIANDLDGMAGVSEPRPAVFVLDGERVVQYAWVASEWPEFPDYDELGAALDGL